MKRNLLSIFLAISIGFLLSNYTVNEYKNSVKAKSNKDYIYLFQIGAYKSEKVMKENCKNIENYFYYYDNKFYHVLIGISMDKKLVNKIQNANEIDQKVYIKKQYVENKEFINNLKQYDKLIKNTQDNTIIINGEKSILAKYNELILNEKSIN